MIKIRRIRLKQIKKQRAPTGVRTLYIFAAFIVGWWIGQQVAVYPYLSTVCTVPYYGHSALLFRIPSASCRGVHVDLLVFKLGITQPTGRPMAADHAHGKMRNREVDKKT